MMTRGARIVLYLCMCDRLQFDYSNFLVVIGKFLVLFYIKAGFVNQRKKILL